MDETRHLEKRGSNCRDIDDVDEGMRRDTSAPATVSSRVLYGRAGGVAVGISSHEHLGQEANRSNRIATGWAYRHFPVKLLPNLAYGLEEKHAKRGPRSDACEIVTVSGEISEGHCQFEEQLTEV